MVCYFFTKIGNIESIIAWVTVIQLRILTRLLKLRKIYQKIWQTLNFFVRIERRQSMSLNILIQSSIIKDIRALSRLVFIFIVDLFSCHNFLRAVSLLLALLWHIDDVRRVVLISDFHWNAVSWSVWRRKVGCQLIFWFVTFEVVHVYALVHFIADFWVFKVHVYRIISVSILWIFELLIEVFFVEVGKIKSLKSILLMICARRFLSLILHGLRRLVQVVEVTRNFLFFKIDRVWVLRGVYIFYINKFGFLCIFCA